jgi:AcrR family transcriptional regulator
MTQSIAVETREPVRRRKEARPAELLAAALDVFADKGFAATRLEDIAAQAGVSKGTVYLYFESKEALFKAAIESAITPVIEAAEAIANETDKPAAELLRTFVFGWWERIGTTSLGAVPKLMVAESGNFPEVARWFHEEIISRALRAMARVIEIGIARGEFRSTDPHLAARIVFSPIFSIVVWRRAFADCAPDLPDPRMFLDTAVALLNDGLATPAKEISR